VGLGCHECDVCWHSRIPPRVIRLFYFFDYTIKRISCCNFDVPRPYLVTLFATFYKMKKIILIILITLCVLYFHGVVDVVDALDKHLRGANHDLQFELFDFGRIGGNPFATPTQDGGRQAELNDMIKEEIGTSPPSASETSQCDSIGFGSRPCGGPSSYLVYSTANTNEPRLKELVSEFNQLDKKRNEELGFASICSIELKPKLGLVDGVCTVKRDVRMSGKSGNAIPG
jgi:hypothetical protein